MTGFDEALGDVLNNYATNLRTAINADTEAAAQKLIDEEKAAKLAEQSPPEDMAEEIKDGFTELTKENKSGL